MTDAEEDPAAAAEEFLAGTSASERRAVLAELLRAEDVDPIAIEALLPPASDSNAAAPAAKAVDVPTAAALDLGDRLRAIATADDPDAVADALAPAIGTLLGTEAAILYRHDPTEAAFVPAARTEAAPSDPPTVTPDDDRHWSAIRGETATVVHADSSRALVVPVPDAGALLVPEADPDAISPVPLDLLDRLASVAVPVADLHRRHHHRGEEIEALRTENEQLRDFANIVSHDLRNPLAVARGYLDLAVQEGDDQYVEKVEEAHDRIESIIEHTLALAEEGSQAGGKTPVELDDIARQAWGVVDAPASALEIADSMVLEADRERLQQLLENLFRNAVEHGSTGPGPNAREDAVEHASTSPHSDAHEDALEHDAPDGAPNADRALTVRVGTTEEGFFVEDDGPGIPPAEREQVFERGYTGSGDGTGIGLDVVSDVVEAHGWSIDVLEGSDGGARFEIDT